ncbi:MAG: DUF1670 domain-containing protein, partial [candidate division Zixibacteria bacterium]|nr:DUF1670 domain-containing protein [candidate division Zixibacteria bacterium]
TGGRLGVRNCGAHPPIFVPNDIGDIFVLLIGLLWQFGERTEDIVRREFGRLENLDMRKVVMINNSSLRKWDRLAQKQLDQQFLHEIIEGLQCSPFEASAMLDTVYRVYAPYFETSGTLKPGQMLFPLVAIETPSQVPLSQSKQVTVTLTMDAGAEDLEVRKSGGVEALRQHRMQRLCIEAFQQGGLLTVEDLANRLFNCGQRTITRDLQALRRQGITLPLRSTIKDMGRSISHRSLIVEQWSHGKEYSEIARATYHSVSSVQNYVSKFKRAIALMEEGYDLHTIAFLVKLSISLVESYQQLYQRVKIVPHRRRELKSFLKKGIKTSPTGGARD